MAKPPSSLDKHLGKTGKLDIEGDDNDLVKLGTLRRWIARVWNAIPSPGAGMNVRRSLFGDVWGLTQSPPEFPFQVKHEGGNNFRVASGQCEGLVIDEVVLDVGATRPVAILAKPQYDLTIFNAEYVSTASVKTGASAPVLVSSTSTLDDVLNVSSAGNEARALIAIILAGDVINQYAYGNINGTWGDHALDGTMQGHFTKTA